MGKLASALVIGFLLVGTAASTGCGGGGSYCDITCDCGRCSSRDYDICLDDYDYESDYASRRDCVPEWDDYTACVEDIGSCHEGRFGCGREWDRYQSCIR